jgi:hypothetical protein
MGSGPQCSLYSRGRRQGRRVPEGCAGASQVVFGPDCPDLFVGRKLASRCTVLRLGDSGALIGGQPHRCFLIVAAGEPQDNASDRILRGGRHVAGHFEGFVKQLCHLRIVAFPGRPRKQPPNMASAGERSHSTMRREVFGAGAPVSWIAIAGLMHLRWRVLIARPTKLPHMGSARGGSDRRGCGRGNE